MNHIKQIIKSIIIGSFFNVVLAEKSTLDSVSWKQFIRSGLVQVSNDNGFSGYYRINRTSNYSFGDLRLYHYSLKNNSYIFIRYKNTS